MMLMTITVTKTVKTARLTKTRMRIMMAPYVKRLHQVFYISFNIRLGMLTVVIMKTA